MLPNEEPRANIRAKHVVELLFHIVLGLVEAFSSEIWDEMMNGVLEAERTMRTEDLGALHPLYRRAAALTFS